MINLSEKKEEVTLVICHILLKLEVLNHEQSPIALCHY